QGDCDEKCNCQKNLPESQLIVGVRIESCQADGPEHLPDVGHIADNSIVESPCEWQLMFTSRTLEVCQPSQYGRNSRQCEQRNFFRYEAADDRTLTSDHRFPSPLSKSGSSDSAEGPVIQQQKNEWKGHQHRFRHQT